MPFIIPLSLAWATALNQLLFRDSSATGVPYVFLAPMLYPLGVE